ncbi:LysR substrate-binding domain-containing protein [Rhizobium sp. CNPSo 4062]|uniref:LysR family transcriptional regulator n=1 Tax=Rhizobium sp. CNPSo 4062 TaxID=3021410 RepID=UPI00254A0E7C|nr:LysR family transcriptional regulator [Rhizobium sp. CNPSo 4062]MDK4703390.1 LysR substrate-binding domain-containing protein [Rhizobium sp. CNPSo 4062]
MDLSDLRVFEAVSRHGSMNRAAQELHTVQSNVTARIRALEEELGVSLFQRHARGVSTTPAGQRILPFVGRLTKLLADARAAAKDDGEPGGTLSLGSLETTTALRLSPLLGQFAKTYPQVRLVVTTGTTRRLIDDVVSCRVDGAFVAGPISHPDLEHEVIFREELVLVTAPAIHTMQDLAKITDLKTIVFQIGCSYRQRLESLLADMGIVTSKPLEFGSLDTIVSCVSAGVGITLLPRGVVANAAREGRIAIHALPPERSMVDTLFVRRKDAYTSSAMTALLDMLRSTQPTNSKP